jgi:hypothetical protein
MGGGSSFPLNKEPAKLQPICLIDFDDFKVKGEYSRHTTETHEVSTLDLSDAFVIYVSHLWLRSRPSMEDFKEYPRPDKENNEQYKLCVAGIESLLENNKIALNKCYLWIDYSCLDQRDPALMKEVEGVEPKKIDRLKEIDRQIGQIMYYCDCMFTPDTGLAGFVRTNTLNNKKKVASSGHSGYLNRGWCMLEMFYASFIPLSKATQVKKKYVSRAVEHSLELQKRPHFVFGAKELAHGKAPLIVPPMRHSTLKTRDPANGYFTHEEDAKAVKVLMKELSYHYMKPVKLGYQGNTDAKGLRHGHGRYVFPSGGVYEGGYKNGLKSGFGRFEMASGDVVCTLYIDVV